MQYLHGILTEISILTSRRARSHSLLQKRIFLGHSMEKPGISTKRLYRATFLHFLLSKSPLKMTEHSLRVSISTKKPPSFVVGVMENFCHNLLFTCIRIPHKLSTNKHRMKSSSNYKANQRPFHWP